MREDRRRRGLGTAVTVAAEDAVAVRGHKRVSLSYGIGHTPAQRLYDKLGYRDAGIEPERVQGTIEVRLGTIEVDETLIYLVKDL